MALEPQAFEVLAYLAEHRERIVSRQELLDAVWGTSFITDGALATRIKEVRRAVGDDGRAQSAIRTIHRRGYRFVAETTSSNGDGPAVAPTDARSVARGPYRAEARALPGRAEEQAVLARLFNEADAGSRRVLFVTGEAGIGKSALTQAFVEPLGGSTEMLLGSGECIEHHGAGEPYLPLLQAVTTIARVDLNGDASLVLRRLAPTWAREIPWLTQEPEAPEGGVTRDRMLLEVVDALEGLSQQRTVVLLLEDLHWSDPSTLDVIEVAARRGGSARLLLICTVRTHDATSRKHSVHAVVDELVARGYASEVSLGPLEADAVDSFLDREAASARPPGNSRRDSGTDRRQPALHDQRAARLDRVRGRHPSR